jgi:hypothetical protein
MPFIGAKPLLAALAASLFVATDSTPPSVRAHHALAYDEVLERVILTAGSTPRDGGNRFEFFNDTWAFDGAQWNLLTASGDQISGVRLAWDAKGRRMLSFGGFLPTNRSVALLREWRDGAWRTIGDLAEQPTTEGGFVYDIRRERFVAFGGSGGRGQYNSDTWEWDGAAWTKLAVSGPSGRMSQAMVYDARRGRTVVFGGMTGQPGSRPTLLNDTWEFDGRAWSQIAIEGPSPRHGAAVAYDSKRGLVMLFGGYAGETLAADTWSFDGRSWQKLADAGPDGRGSAMAYDAKRDRLVLFGGRGDGWPNGDKNDTWEWDGTQWARVP